LFERSEIKPVFMTILDGGLKDRYVINTKRTFLHILPDTVYISLAFVKCLEIAKFLYIT